MQWTRLAYNRDPAEPFGDFAGLNPGQVPAGSNGRKGPVPPYPVASNQRDDHRPPALSGGEARHPLRSELDGLKPETVREEIRRLILEELAQLAGG